MGRALFEFLGSSSPRRLQLGSIVIAASLAIAVSDSHVLFAQEVCGAVPTLSPELLSDENLKGQIAGEARALSGLIGKGNLSGQVEASRKKLYQSSDKFFAAQSDAYLAYVFCQVVMNDKSLTAQQKIQAIQEFRRVPQTELNRQAPSSERQQNAVNEKDSNSSLNSRDPAVRSKALSELLMKREGIRVEFVESNSTDAKTKAWMQRFGGAIFYQFKNRDPDKNCINFSNARPACYGDTLFVIDGLKVRLTDRSKAPSLTGEFALQADNSLKGFIWPQNLPAVPAKINLL